MVRLNIEMHRRNTEIHVKTLTHFEQPGFRTEFLHEQRMLTLILRFISVFLWWISTLSMDFVHAAEFDSNFNAKFAI